MKKDFTIDLQTKKLSFKEQVTTDVEVDINSLLTRKKDIEDQMVSWQAKLQVELDLVNELINQAKSLGFVEAELIQPTEVAPDVIN